jgi:hypothetical protein
MPDQTVRLTQPPRSLSKTPEELAWLEQLARIVNALISSGGVNPAGLFEPWRPSELLFPGRFFFDYHPDVGTGGGTPIWRNASNTGWVDGTGASI